MVFLKRIIPKKIDVKIPSSAREINITTKNYYEQILNNNMLLSFKTQKSERDGSLSITFFITIHYTNINVNIFHFCFTCSLYTSIRETLKCWEEGATEHSETLND